MLSAESSDGSFLPPTEYSQSVFAVRRLKRWKTQGRL